MLPRDRDRLSAAMQEVRRREAYPLLVDNIPSVLGEMGDLADPAYVPIMYPTCRAAHVLAGGIPIFTPRSAVTREMFNFIIELRPSTTSGRLEETFRRE